MKILLIGGSNSLMKDGYVQHLQRALEGRAEAGIRQLSVGATTSLSAIGRLHDSYDGSPVDFIVYEYAINDAGHFAPRGGGIASWELCLQLLLQTAAKLYPDAVLVPLLLAQQQHFAAAAPHPLYDAQIAAYRRLALPYVDVRAWMAQLFLDRAPDWMYQDPAHYAAPQATSIIGALLARHLLGLRDSGAETLGAVWRRARADAPDPGLELIYLPATRLQQFCSGPAQTGSAANRLMRLDYLRLGPGASLRLASAMFPLALYLKSDTRHDCLRVALSTADGPLLDARVASRHADTDSFAFIYTSIPLPLLWGETLLTPFVPSTLELSVPAAAGGAQTGFDCFAGGRPDAPEHYLDLVGILMLCQAATPA